MVIIVLSTRRSRRDAFARRARWEWQYIAGTCLFLKPLFWLTGWEFHTFDRFWIKPLLGGLGHELWYIAMGGRWHATHLIDPIVLKAVLDAITITFLPVALIATPLNCICPATAIEWVSFARKPIFLYPTRRGIPLRGWGYFSAIFQELLTTLWNTWNGTELVPRKTL
jgi:hypothetical protein